MRLRRLPLWLKYALTACVFVPLAVATGIYIHNQTNAPPPQAPPLPSAQTTRGVMERDQAVHHAADPSSLTPAVGLERAILADVRTRIARHEISGHARKVSCVRLAHKSAGRLAFSCHAFVGDLSYAFRGVVDLATRTLTWCKDDNISAAGSIRVPLNAACIR